MNMLPLRIPPADGGPVNFSVAAPLDPVAAPGSLRALLREAWRRHRSRARLAELSDHMLKDIGITRAEAWRESSKPFWRG